MFKQGIKYKYLLGIRSQLIMTTATETPMRGSKSEAYGGRLREARIGKLSLREMAGISPSDVELLPEREWIS
jgi:hypothetical protein